MDCSHADDRASTGLRANGVLLVREKVLEYENLTYGYQNNQYGLGDRPVGHAGVQVLGALSSSCLVQLVVRLLFEQSVQRFMNVIHTCLDLFRWIDDEIGRDRSVIFEIVVEVVSQCGIHTDSSKSLTFVIAV